MLFLQKIGRRGQLSLTITSPFKGSTPGASGGQKWIWNNLSHYLAQFCKGEKAHHIFIICREKRLQVTEHRWSYPNWPFCSKWLAEISFCFFSGPTTVNISWIISKARSMSRNGSVWVVLFLSWIPYSISKHLTVLWIRIQWGPWFPIRIRNPDPDPKGQKWPTKI